MSDQNARKKGMRTFASDFERLKGSKSQSAAVATTHTATPHMVTPPKSDQKKAIPAPPIATVTKNPDTPNKIPAFHEIEKNLEDIDLSGTEKKKTSPIKKRHAKGITPSKRVGGGAIITDTKAHSFSLFSETKKSIASWFKSRKKKTTPKLAVPKAERRKGVIQQATTKSGTIFTADNETLKERIKARKLQEQSKLEDPETNWSPYTETGYPLLESGHEPPAEITPTPATANVVVEFKKRSTPTPTPSAPVPQPIAEPQPEVTPTPEVPKVEVPAEPAAPTLEVVESEPEQPVDRESTPTPEPTIAETPLTEPTTSQAEEEEIVADTTLTTNQLTMYVSGAMALVLVTGFFGWIVMNGTPNNSEDSDGGVHKFAELATSEVIVIDQTFTVDSLRTYTGSAAYTEVALANTNSELLPAALVFELVAPDMPTTIQQFATDVRFIQFDTNVPQVMIEIVDPISVTGALLVNESDLISALTPLYGTIDSGSFTDTSIAGTDARVLMVDAQQTFTYGIINGDTLIIAVSPDAFTEISTLISN